MNPFFRWPFIPLILFLLPFSLILNCDSDEDKDGDEIVVPGCNVSLLESGTYTFAVTSVDEGCLKEYEGIIKGRFDGTTVQLPSFKELSADNSATLTMLGVTVTAKIVHEGDNLIATDIDPNPIDIIGGTVTMNSITLCPESSTQIIGDLNITIEALILSCTGTFGVRSGEFVPDTGLIRYEEGALDGYTLMNVIDKGAFLLNMLGEEVHVLSSVIGGNVHPGGIILGGDEVLPQPTHELFSLIQTTWDGTVEWSYSGWEEVPEHGWMSRAHHDFQREGNPVGYYAPGQDFVRQGKTLVLAHRDVTVPEISPIPLLDDIIYEIDWSHNPTAFLWRGADHIDEFGFDESALIGISQAGYDWLHINAIARLGKNHWYDDDPTDQRFHPENIILDSRHGTFIVILHHQTGNVVWRVGPNFPEGTPDGDLGPLIGVHHAHMIPKGLPGGGNILVYDNGGEAGWTATGINKYSRASSRVVEFDPTTLEIVWEYSPELGHDMDYSPLVSSAQRLPNGNTFITSGLLGRLIEVTPDHQIVWEFKVALSVSRAFRVPPEWVPLSHGYDPWEEE
jgi:hypothetical protein